LAQEELPSCLSSNGMGQARQPGDELGSQESLEKRGSRRQPPNDRLRHGGRGAEYPATVQGRLSGAVCSAALASEADAANRIRCPRLEATDL
jgi:hypothetical protein